MILIGSTVFGLDDAGMFQTNNATGIPSSFDITNSVVDEVSVSTNVTDSFSTTKDTWDSSMIMIAPFESDLHCGNMSLHGLTITELRFKKRKTNSLEWIWFDTLEFDSDITSYEVIDRIVEAGEEYEYAVCPYGTVEGDYKLSQITVKFDGTFISDKSSYYKLIYNLEMGSTVYNLGSPSVIETIGGQYPFVVYPSANYRSGSVKCTLISDSTISNHIVDTAVEKGLRKQILSFLTNKKPKILKDDGGNFMLINIISTPSLTPISNSIKGIYDLSFSFVEIGDGYDVTTLQNAGLIEGE